MKSTLFAAVALASLGFASVSFAGSFDDRINGELSGSASTFAGSAGGSIGNGNSMSEAGQFSGAESTLQFDGRFGSNNSNMDGISGRVTSESFSEGFDRARSNGSALGAGVRGGWAAGNAEFNGWGSDSW